MATFYDTHGHLDYPDFAADFPQVLERAQAAGIRKLIAIGTDLASSRQCLALAEQHPQIYAVVGWHPNQAMEAPADFPEALRELARHPRVVGLGETGIDYYRLPADPAAAERSRQRQAALFTQHLKVAAETGLNCVIHQRAAFEETFALFQPFADRVRRVFHCLRTERKRCGGSWRRSLVSFTGILTFKNGRNIRDTLAATPLGQFMLETDCRSWRPMPYRGKRCEPAYVREIATVAAQVKAFPWTNERSHLRDR